MHRARVLITLLVLLAGIARMGFAAPKLTDAHDANDLFTSKSQAAIKSISRTNLPVSNEVTRDRQVLVLFTAGASFTDVVAIAKPSSSGREIADALAGGLRDTALDDIELRYGVNEDLAVVSGSASHGHFGATSGQTTLPIQQVGNAFRLRGWDVTIVVRAGKYGERKAIGLAKDEGPNWMWYSAHEFESASSLTMRAEVGGFAMVAFYFFLCGPWLLCALGILSAMAVGKRQSIPIEKRRVLYSKLALWPTYGGIAVHAPFAIWFLVGRGYRPFADLWFGTYSALSISPFIMLPLPALIVLVPLSAKIERKLFGTTEAPPVALPRLSAAETEVNKRIARVQMGILGIGLILTVIGFLLPSKELAGSLCKIGGILIAALGVQFVPVFFRRWLRTFDVDVQDPDLEATAQSLAGAMGVTVSSLKIDGSAEGRLYPNASASPRAVVTVTARLRDILNEREMRAVLAHEIAHLSLRHPQQRRAVRIAVFTAAIVPATIAFLVSPGSSNPFRLLALALPLAVIPPLILFTAPALRRQEYAADRLMLETTRDLEGAISAFEKMARNSGAPELHEVEVGQNHPAMSKRIERLKEIAAELGIA